MKKSCYKLFFFSNFACFLFGVFLCRKKIRNCLSQKEGS